MQIEILSRNRLTDIRSLICQYQFNDYRYCRLPKVKLDEYLIDCITRVLKNNTKNQVFIATDQRAIVGMTILNFLQWDTKHFGFNMAQLKYLMAEGDYCCGHNIKDLLLAAISRYCKKEGITHLSCRIDTEDHSAVHALENNEFKLADTLVKYVLNCHKRKICDIRNLCKVRLFKDQDLPALVEIAKTSFTKDRFHSDPSIDQEKADDFYVKWITSACQDNVAGKVFVAEKNNLPVGFLTVKFDKDFEKLTGCKIGGRGINAVAVEAKGSYPGLAKALIQEGILNHDFIEWDSQVNNYEVIKVWQRFGLEFKRAQHTFHKWISKLF